MKTAFKTYMLLALTQALIASFYACAGGKAVKAHPDVPNPLICSECHMDNRGALSHTGDFIRRHGLYENDLCSACHRVFFCNECHANREELKPADRVKDSPWRTPVHEGDYLTRHKIDGRTNPARCFTCHGRTNNERCTTCHR